MKELMEEITLEEMEDCAGMGDWDAAYCAWVWAGCASQAGCGGPYSCQLYKEHCM